MTAVSAWHGHRGRGRQPWGCSPHTRPLAVARRDDATRPVTSKGASSGCGCRRRRPRSRRGSRLVVQADRDALDEVLVVADVVGSGQLDRLPVRIGGEGITLDVDANGRRPTRHLTAVGDPGGHPRARGVSGCLVYRGSGRWVAAAGSAGVSCGAVCVGIRDGAWLGALSRCLDRARKVMTSEPCAASVKSTRWDPTTHAASGAAARPRGR